MLKSPKNSEDLNPAMNSDLELLQLYPFQRLLALKQAVNAPEDLDPIALSIGEPKHPAPPFVLDALSQNLEKLTQYPLTKGILELREAIAAWLTARFKLAPKSVSAEANVIPVSGTREALFAIAQAVVTRDSKARVLMPNPFYQIYEGAALLAGATPYFLNCTAENDFIPDFDCVPENVWESCELIYICTPGNPTGSVLTTTHLNQLIELSDRHNFVIASDECYSELYFDEAKPPMGLLQACAQIGRNDFKNCLVFHSLSKRSNLPGLRSGFVAGDKQILEKFLHYRTYQGCALPLPTQYASIAAWSDERHVRDNRALYCQKFATVIDILDDVLPLQKPDASFYLWPKTPISDTEFAQQLFAKQNVTVLPGRFLARDTIDGNPGENFVRMALVAPLEECAEAANRIKAFIESL